jgi:hypothetical protein
MHSPLWARSLWARLLWARLLLAPLLALPALPATAADPQRWEAFSKTAMSITGDITLSADRITMAGRSFPLERVRDYADPRQIEAFQTAMPISGSQKATLYRTRIEPTVRLENGNTLCGEAAIWLLAIERRESPAGLVMAAYQGTAELTPAVSEQRLCAAFTYQLGSSTAAPPNARR